jgi:MurNAc alpha-1-phosphate uridylyltransferase
VTISDERDAVLGTGGGVVKALPLLGEAPFFHVNSDTMWMDGVRPNLARLAEAFDPARMDILLLMAPTTSSIGYQGRGDYAMAADGTLRKRKELQVVPFVYAGVAIMSPAIFADAPKGEFSLTKMFDRAGEQERLYGLRLDGVWMHVGTPDAIQAAEEAFLDSVA